ncbi:MAG TPA: hypothetical protein VMC86_09335 [Gemmatimonadales bacterium]|nr:hypothetical protein [Gemmatimonadales bacterium]
MTHCTMDDLLALRDNEGSAWARRHADGCEACRKELEALYQRMAQLKALPPRSPARDRWPEIRTAVLAARRRRNTRWAGWSMAAAAVLAGVMVFRPFAPPSARAGELARARATSAQLEDRLRSSASEGRVLTGRDAAVIAQLEDQIAAIDGQLGTRSVSGVDAQLQLWQQRVNLMNQLVQVRVVRASYVGL